MSALAPPRSKKACPFLPGECGCRACESQKGRVLTVDPSIKEGVSKKDVHPKKRQMEILYGHPTNQVQGHECGKHVVPEEQVKAPKNLVILEGREAEGVERFGAGFNPILMDKKLIYSSDVRDASPLPARKMNVIPPDSEGHPTGWEVKKVFQFYQSFVPASERMESAKIQSWSLDGVPQKGMKGWAFEVQNNDSIIFWSRDGYCFFRCLAAFLEFNGLEQTYEEWYYSADLFGVNSIRKTLPRVKNMRFVAYRVSDKLRHVGLEIDFSKRPEDNFDEQGVLDLIANEEEETRNRANQQQLVIREGEDLIIPGQNIVKVRIPNGFKKRGPKKIQAQKKKNLAEGKTVEDIKREAKLEKKGFKEVDDPVLKTQMKLNKMKRRIDKAREKLEALKVASLKPVEKKNKQLPLTDMVTVPLTKRLNDMRFSLIGNYRKALSDKLECEYCPNNFKLLMFTTMLNVMRRGLYNQDLVDFGQDLGEICVKCACTTSKPVLFDKALFAKLEKMGIAFKSVQEVKVTQDKEVYGGFMQTLSRKLWPQGVTGMFFQNCPKLQAHAISCTSGKSSEYWVQVGADSEHAGSRLLANIYQSENFGTERNTLYVDVQSKFINSLDYIRELYTYQPDYTPPARKPRRIEKTVERGAGFLLYRQNVTVMDDNYMHNNLGAAIKRIGDLLDIEVDVTVELDEANKRGDMATKTKGTFDLESFYESVSEYVAMRARLGVETGRIVFIFSDMHWYVDHAAWNKMLKRFPMNTSVRAVGMDFPSQNGWYYIGDGEGTVEILDGTVTFHARGNGAPYVHPNTKLGMTDIDSTQMTPHGGHLSINYRSWIGINFGDCEVKTSYRRTPQIPQVTSYLSKDFKTKSDFAVTLLRHEVNKNITAQIVQAAVILNKDETKDTLPAFIKSSITYFLHRVFIGRLPASGLNEEDHEQLRRAILFQGFKENAEVFFEICRHVIIAVSTVCLAIWQSASERVAEVCAVVWGPAEVVVAMPRTQVDHPLEMTGLKVALWNAYHEFIRLLPEDCLGRMVSGLEEVYTRSYNFLEAVGEGRPTMEVGGISESIMVFVEQVDTTIWAPAENLTGLTEKIVENVVQKSEPTEWSDDQWAAVFFLCTIVAIRELIVLVYIIYVHISRRKLKAFWSQSEIMERNGVSDILFSGLGDVEKGFFVVKPVEEVQDVNQENPTFVSCTYYLGKQLVDEKQFRDAAVIADKMRFRGPRAPMKTGFEFMGQTGKVRSYAYDHTSIVNLLHAISNRLFRPMTRVDPEWLGQLNFVTDREFRKLDLLITPEFMDEYWLEPEALLKTKEGWGERKKEVYRDAIRKQKMDNMGALYYTGFVKALETYSNPKNLRGNVIYGDKKRARIVENRPEIAAGIPWLISNWLNGTLGTLLPEYSYRASEKKLSKFLEERKEKQEVHTLSTDFGAMDSTVYHETQEAVERKLLRVLFPKLRNRLIQYGFTPIQISKAFKWMTAHIKTTKFFTSIGKIILRRRGGRASGDPSTTWANTLTTIMFYKTCCMRSNVSVVAKVSGDDLTCFSANKGDILALRNEMLATTSREPEEDVAHSGFVIPTEECVLGLNRATFCSKTLHVKECAVLPKLSNFYFNSRHYCGTNRFILKDWRMHRFAVALSRLLAAGQSRILQEYPIQLCRALNLTGTYDTLVSTLRDLVRSAKINYFEMFGDFWESQEIQSVEDVDYLVVTESKIEKINIEVMLMDPDGNEKCYLMSGFKNKRIMKQDKGKEARNMMSHFFHPDGKPTRISGGGRKDIAVGMVKQHYTDTSSNSIKFFRFQMHDLNTLGYVYYPTSGTWTFSPSIALTGQVGPTGTEYLVTSFGIVMEETASVTNVQGRFYVLQTNEHLTADQVKQHPNTQPLGIRETVIHNLVPDTPNDMLFIRAATDQTVLEKYLYVVADGVSANSRIAVSITAKYEFVITNQYKGIASPAQRIGSGTRVLDWVSDAAGRFNSLSPETKKGWFDQISNLFSSGSTFRQAINGVSRVAAPVLALMSGYKMDGGNYKALNLEQPVKRNRVRKGRRLVKAKPKALRKKKKVAFAGFKKVGKVNYIHVEGTGEAHPQLLTIDGSTFVEVNSIKPEEAKLYWLEQAKQIVPAEDTTEGS